MGQRSAAVRARNKRIVTGCVPPHSGAGSFVSTKVASASSASRQKNRAWSRSSRLRILSCVTVNRDPGPSPESRQVTWLSGSKSNGRQANSSFAVGTAAITRPRYMSPFRVLRLIAPSWASSRSASPSHPARRSGIVRQGQIEDAGERKDR